jgi:transcriptional regulator with XRE-family HTH domain
MGRPASERDERFKQEVAAYLQALHVARGWSQSKMARESGVVSTTISRAYNGKQVLGLHVLLVLEERANYPLPESLLEAAKGRRSQGHASPEEVADFLNSSPAWRQMIALGQQLAAATDPKEKAEIQRQIQELAAAMGQ